MKTRKEDKWYNSLYVLLLAPLWIPIGFFVFVLFLLASTTIYGLTWLFWGTRRIHLLYVYSNSPTWQTHIEQEILPKLPERKIILNWSERKLWKRFSLAALTFQHFGGYRAFNPMAVILKPFHRAKVFRFYEAFKDYKHGKIEKLADLEADFFETLKK